MKKYSTIKTEVFEDVLKALQFYSKREHWMALTEDSDDRKLLVAIGDTQSTQGWAMAERAMQKLVESLKK